MRCVLQITTQQYLGGNTTVYKPYAHTIEMSFIIQIYSDLMMLAHSASFNILESTIRIYDLERLL